MINATERFCPITLKWPSAVLCECVAKQIKENLYSWDGKSFSHRTHKLFKHCLYPYLRLSYIITLPSQVLFSAFLKVFLAISKASCILVFNKTYTISFSGVFLICHWNLMLAYLHYMPLILTILERKILSFLPFLFDPSSSKHVNMYLIVHTWVLILNSSCFEAVVEDSKILLNFFFKWTSGFDFFFWVGWAGINLHTNSVNLASFYSSLLFECVFEFLACELHHVNMERQVIIKGNDCQVYGIEPLGGSITDCRPSYNIDNKHLLFKTRDFWNKILNRWVCKGKLLD